MVGTIQDYCHFTVWNCLYAVQKKLMFNDIDVCSALIAVFLSKGSQRKIDVVFIRVETSCPVTQIWAGLQWIFTIRWELCHDTGTLMEMWQCTLEVISIVITKQRQSSVRSFYHDGFHHVFKDASFLLLLFYIQHAGSPCLYLGSSPFDLKRLMAPRPVAPQAIKEGSVSKWVLAAHILLMGFSHRQRQGWSYAWVTLFSP